MCLFVPYLPKSNNKIYRINQNILIRVNPIPANIYLFKVNSRHTRKRLKVCSKLTIQTPERRHRGRSGIFTANFEHISHPFLVFDFEQVNILSSILTFYRYSLSQYIYSE